jgi:phosphatidylinositol alpha-mannosyltransferase
MLSNIGGVDLPGRHRRCSVLGPMMRRVLLATPYDLAVPGGVNSQVFGLFRALVARGVDVRLVGPSSAELTDADPRVRTLGRPVALPFNGATSRVSLDLRVIPALRRLVREFDPDVVHVQEPVAPLPCAALLWLAPARALRVGTFHTYSETSLGYLISWPWTRWVWSRLHVRVAVSEAAREFATRFHPLPFRIIPNAIELPAPPPPPPTNQGPCRVLFIGRLDEERKGFGPLLRAVRAVETGAPGTLTLTAVGRGADQWRQEAEGLPISFDGEVGNAEIARAYADADVVAIPSVRGESFGLVALEAMAHGRPVIASQIAGYSAWLEDVARLVPPGDEVTLARALKDLATSPALRADLTARGARLAQQYSWDAVVERWLAVYRAGARSSLT